eukprot:13742707-Alexandrium_andersonii.AAC.1
MFTSLDDDVSLPHGGPAPPNGIGEAVGVLARGGRPPKQWADPWPLAIVAVSASNCGSDGDFGLGSRPWRRCLQHTLGTEDVEGLRTAAGARAVHGPLLGLAVVRGCFIDVEGDVPEDALAREYAAALVAAHP